MTSRVHLGVLTALLPLLLPFALQAEELTLEDVLAAHCRARETTATLQAQFVQKRILSLFDEEETSEGKLFFAQPDRICWQYTEPDESSTVIHGENGWSVFPHIKQIQKFELDGSKTNKILSVVGFGSCGAALTESFDVTLAARKKDAFVLEMQPLDEGITPYFSRVDLTLDRRDYLPRKIELHERAGDLIVFEFSKVRRNVDLDEDVFLYRVPDGYEVVEY